MDRTICPSRRVVYIAALQQIIFNADRTALERMIRDQGRTTKVPLSSQVLTSILDKYVQQWMGEDAIDGLCFYPPGEQSSLYFDVLMIRELIALVREQVGALGINPRRELIKWLGICGVPGSLRKTSELSSHQMAVLSGGHRRCLSVTSRTIVYDRRFRPGPAQDPIVHILVKWSCAGTSHPWVRRQSSCMCSLLHCLSLLVFTVCTLRSVMCTLRSRVHVH